MRYKVIVGLLAVVVLGGLSISLCEYLSNLPKSEDPRWVEQQENILSFICIFSHLFQNETMTNQSHNMSII